MTLILIEVMGQSIISTFHWLGFYFGIRSLPDEKPGKRRWVVASALVFSVWLVTIVLLASNNFFVAQRVPIGLLATLLAGYLFLFSKTFRQVLANIPQHWLVGVQVFRLVGGIFLVPYVHGQIPGFFAIPSSVGDMLTGLFAPLVAYGLYTNKSWARKAAIAWNIFGMLDIVNGITLGTVAALKGGPTLFPLVLSPIYAVPRAFLLHSYSMIGLFRKTSPIRQSPDPLYGIGASRI